MPEDYDNFRIADDQLVYVHRECGSLVRPGEKGTHDTWHKKIQLKENKGENSTPR